MDIDLKGRSALVTGSTGGIGYAIAKALGQLGATVAVNGRTGERVNAAIERLRGEVPGAGFVAGIGDVGTEEGAAELVAALPKVDILINNAGIFEPKPFFEIPDGEWRRFFEVNVMSGIRLARAYGPGMVERGWGRIVFIASESGINIPVEMVHYGMTKTAQLAVSRGLAETVGGSGVTVNSVLPGPTLTEGVADFLESMGGGEIRKAIWRPRAAPSSPRTARPRSSSASRSRRRWPAWWPISAPRRPAPRRGRR